MSDDGGLTTPVGDSIGNTAVETDDRRCWYVSEMSTSTCSDRLRFSGLDTSAAVSPTEDNDENAYDDCMDDEVAGMRSGNKAPDMEWANTTREKRRESEDGIDKRGGGNASIGEDNEYGGTREHESRAEQRAEQWVEYVEKGTHQDVRNLHPNYAQLPIETLLLNYPLWRPILISSLRSAKILWTLVC